MVERTVGRRLLIHSFVLGGVAPGFQFLAQTRDLSPAGYGLLLQLQHHVLQLMDLALQFLQSSSVAGGCSAVESAQRRNGNAS